MKRTSTTNQFSDGLVMDMNPLVTPNTVLTNALNATLITMNGNELVLQNDMGNGKVETAYLPEGYVPLGTAELGGIIYIVSYNPFRKTCQIGSFPSPERNLVGDEVGDPVNLYASKFYKQVGDLQFITTPQQAIILTDKTINPGDKFIVYFSNDKELDEKVKQLSAYGEPSYNQNLLPKYLKLDVVAIQENGTINKLTDSLVWYDKYYIHDPIDSTVEEYTNLIKSNYSVFQSKVSGQLGILGTLECIDNFDITWDAVKVETGWQFYFYSNWEYSGQEASKVNPYNCLVSYNGINSEIALNLPYLKEDGGVGLAQCDTVAVQREFYNPNKVSSIFDYISVDENYETIGITGEPRKNDGTDNDFVFTGPLITQTEGNITFDVIPGMPFGYLEYLKSSITVDISKLGSGEIDLIAYQYYISNDNINVKWGLEVYPERNKKVSSVTFNWYNWSAVKDFDINKIDNSFIKQISDQYSWVESYDDKNPESTDYSLENKVYTKIIDDKTSYSGYDSFTITELDKIQLNKLYLVEINVAYDNIVYHFYRLMFTNRIFNNYFGKGDYKDFKTIILDDALKNYSPISYYVSDFTSLNYSTGQNIEDTNGITVPEYDITPSIQTDAEVTKDYRIKNTQGTSVNFQILPKCEYFDVELSNFKATSEMKLGAENNGNVSQVIVNGASEIPDQFDNSSTVKVSQSNVSSDGKVSANLNIETITPFQIIYDIQNTQQVTYEFSPIKIGYFILSAYMTTEGAQWLRVETMQGSFLGEHFAGDNDNIFLSINNYGEITTALKAQLKNYDVLVLEVKDKSEKHASDRRTGVGIGPYVSTNDQNTRFGNEIRGQIREDRYAPVLVLYAFLDDMDNIVLFSPTRRKIGIQSGNNRVLYKPWYGYVDTVIEGVYSDTAAVLPDDTPFMTRVPDEITPDNLPNEFKSMPLRKYFKYSSYNGYVDVYSYRVISYYPLYKVTVTGTVEGTCTDTLSLSGDEIVSNSNVNNLNYNSPDCTVSFQIQQTVDCTKYLNLVLIEDSSSSVYVLCKYPKYIITSRSVASDISSIEYTSELQWETEIKKLQVDTRGIYDRDRHLLSYLRKDSEVPEHYVFASQDFKKEGFKGEPTDWSISILGSTMRVNIGSIESIGGKDTTVPWRNSPANTAKWSFYIQYEEQTFGLVPENFYIMI